MRLAGEFRYDISQHHVANPFLGSRAASTYPQRVHATILSFIDPSKEMSAAQFKICDGLFGDVRMSNYHLAKITVKTTSCAFRSS
jgi:hypothetical protein